MPSDPAVNTSPLIFLSKSNQLDLLKVASSKIIVPSAVVQEIKTYGESDLTYKALISSDWLIETEINSIPAIISSWDLGYGESAVLTWGYTNPGTEVILDDLAARRCARTLSIPVRGTLGLVLTAKQQGKILAARPILEQLIASGMYLSEKVINQALKLVGE